MKRGKHFVDGLLERKVPVGLGAQVRVSLSKLGRGGSVAVN